MEKFTGKHLHWFSDIKINPQYLAVFQVFSYLFYTLSHLSTTVINCLNDCYSFPGTVFLTWQKMGFALLIFQFLTYQNQKIYKKTNTTQKVNFSIKTFFSKCYHIPRKLRILSHLLKKSLLKNFIFCALKDATSKKSWPLKLMLKM